MSVVYLFPGQGAQFVGMAQEFYEEFSEAREIYAVASQALGLDLARLCFEDPDEVIGVTEFTQPALLTASYACYAVWRRRNPEVAPTFVAGLSLGEYTALVAAESINFMDAVRLTRLRGRFMQDAVPRGVGAMAAIMGLSAGTVEALCQAQSTDEAWVEVANYNCPGQVAISGHTKAVRALCQEAKAAGANKAVVLPVSAPFHCRLLEPAMDKLAQALEQVCIRDAKVPVVANVNAEPIVKADDIRNCLIRQVASPVRFEQSLQFLIRQGTRMFVELGPGTTIAKFIERFGIPQLASFSVSDLASLDVAAQELKAKFEGLPRP